MAPNGIPWELWRKSNNIEDMREETESQYIMAQYQHVQDLRQQDKQNEKLIAYRETVDKISKKYGSSPFEWPDEAKKEADDAYKHIFNK